MKALEIIKQWDNMEFGDSLEQHKRKIDEAIKELEELNNRSCKSCNQCSDSCINLSTNTTGFCMYYGIRNGDFEEDMKNSFCCNKYEQKDSK